MSELTWPITDQIGKQVSTHSQKMSVKAHNRLLLESITSVGQIIDEMTRMQDALSICSPQCHSLAMETV